MHCSVLFSDCFVSFIWVACVGSEWSVKKNWREFTAVNLNVLARCCGSICCAEFCI